MYIYKLTADSGCAPCVDGELLTLAICKPRIRRGAQAGDLLIGFAGSELSPDNRLIYIARVTAVEDDGGYYDKPTYRDRRDWIYVRRADGRFEVRAGARCQGTEEDLQHDLGTFPHYEKARVLVSEDFRYFGRSGGLDLRPYPALRQRLQGVGIRDFQVNHPPELESELRSLCDQLGRTIPRRAVGTPRASDGSARGECHAPSPARRTCG